MNDLQNKSPVYNPRDDFVEENSEVPLMRKASSKIEPTLNVVNFTPDKVDIDFAAIDNRLLKKKHSKDIAEDFKDISTGDDPFMFNTGQI